MGTTGIKNSLAERFATLRNEHPHFTSERLLNILLSEGHWNGHRPSRSAFYRFAKIKGLGRKRKDATAIQEASAFAYEAFGQMWVADFLHGPKIRVGRHLKKTYLLAIIDDATRYIVYAAFRSRHLLHVAAKLSMHLPHTPAYRPQGLGKIERFFRTVREQCLDGIKSESIENLKGEFATWLEEYHHRVHGSIGCSPLNKRLESTKVTRTLPEVAQLDLFFGMQERRKIHRNGTLHLQGKVYDIKNALPGSIVDVYYLPWDLSTIHVGPDRLPAKPVDLLANAHRHEHNPLRGKEVTP